MTFKDWIYSSYPNPKINGQWGALHIITLLLCIGIIVTLALTLRKRSLKARRIVLFSLAGLIFLFELTRRIIIFSQMTDITFNSFMGTLLPRPWCAIACWTIMIAVLVNKKTLYNFASFSALLCAIIFFAYPGVGFNNKYILFENLYSICTHALLLITSITFITLKFTKFEYKTIWKDLICYGVVLAYALLEIFVLKIESDPMYFMPGSDIQEILGIGYGAFLALYIIFIIIYINLFYLIDDRKNVKKLFKRKNAKEIDGAENTQNLA